jgi:NitT/TauT family transport system substrate-binding protein
MMDRRSVLTSGLAAGAATLAACSKPSPRTAAGVPAPPPGATKIRFATDWRAEAEHGGFYQALATGEYARRGLDVTIIPGGPGVSVPTLLAAGAIELGIGSNSFGVMNLAAQNVPVKAVMATMQKDPQVLLAHPDVGIKSIADMKGHPMLIGDEAVTSFWLWLKAKYGFSDAMVRKYTFNSGPFIADKEAVQEGYVSSEPYTIEKQAGFKPEVFLLADNGYPGYAGMVLAPDALIASNPKAVKAFVDGAAAGWTSYLTGDAKPGDALIRKDNPDMGQDVLDQARDKFRQYAIFGAPPGAGGGAPIGTMTDAKWKTFFDTASSLGVYPKTLDWKRAYTLAFL